MSLFHSLTIVLENLKILRSCYVVIQIFFYLPILQLPKLGANLKACRLLFVCKLIFLIIHSNLTRNTRFYKCLILYHISDGPCEDTLAQSQKSSKEGGNFIAKFLPKSVPTCKCNTDATYQILTAGLALPVYDDRGVKFAFVCYLTFEGYKS